MTRTNIPHNIEQHEPNIRDTNFRRPPPSPPQIKKRDPRNPGNPEDQQIRPPFLEYYVDEEEENDQMDNQRHHFDVLYTEVYLIEEEHNLFSQEDDCNAFEIESEQYQKGYQNAIDYFQKKLKFRSRDVFINKGRPNSNHPSSSEHNVEKQTEKT